MADAKRPQREELLVVAVFLQAPLEAQVSATEKKLQHASGPPERFAEAGAHALTTAGGGQSVRIVSLTAQVEKTIPRETSEEF